MTKKFNETSEFKKLKKEWDAKLKASGFDDIETDSDTKHGIVTKQQFKVDHSKVAYHLACMSYLHQGKFKDELDRFIFEMHCEGISTHKTADLIAQRNNFKTIGQPTVYRRLMKILSEAGIPPMSFNS